MCTYMYVICINFHSLQGGIIRCISYNKLVGFQGRKDNCYFLRGRGACSSPPAAYNAIHVTPILAVITYIVQQNKKACSGAISVVLGGTRTVRISNQMADQVNHNVLL